MSSRAVAVGDQGSISSRIRSRGRSGPWAKRTSIRVVPKCGARSAGPRSRLLPRGPGLLERGHEGPDAFQGGRRLPDRVDLGVEARQVMNALQEPLP